MTGEKSAIIIFDDGDLIAAVKPAGMLVHSSPIDKNCTENFADLVSRDCGTELKLLHRLDKPTSGLVLFCRSAVLARGISDLFLTQHPEKRYLAVCRGWPNDEGRIDHPLRTIVDSRGKKVLKGDLKEAVTTWKVIKRYELPFPDRHHPTSRLSLCEINPQTGRFHQIRRHFKHISHQIIGDTTHGDGFYNRLFREKVGISRMMLHALSITFAHPISGVQIRIETEIPGEFSSSFLGHELF
ncbi:tRNA pseudouridine(65) synthase TruC [Myxococcota bacterium]|nr:tRNA pseudouridine(65) synthase TruC [Myxococcota bacterium]MBU1381349.1 tRNA pseudouridine(65) synthase TruC [Myxococcota bacterium]MBU1495977.1 tRNA pseudouridine(65) synthase TruC [Myxococcota bacterium]